jgi:hypothetical protein
MIPANAALGLAWRAVALASPLLLACAAAAQPRVLDLNVLALDWARGRYLSPVICETDGELVRGGRRLLITPGPRHARPPTDRILFSDLEVPDATRCFDELGVEQPNVLGQLEFRHLARARPDTAQRDFKAALRRDRGFEFAIARGTLRIQPVGSDEPRDVDFGGGEARLHAIAPGSDDARLLGDLIGLRKLVLELESPDGTLLRLPLLMTELR